MKEILRGSIWWADFPVDELNPHVQYGNRPVVVISNNKGNQASSVVLVCPITTKRDKYFYIHPTVVCENGRKSYVLCEQVRVLTKELLGEYIKQVTPEEEAAIDRALMFEMALDKYTYDVDDIKSEEKADDNVISEEEKLGRFIFGIVDIFKRRYKSNDISPVPEFTKTERQDEDNESKSEQPKYLNNEMGWSDDKAEQFLKDYVHMSPRSVVKKYDLKSFRIATKLFSKWKQDESL